MGVNKGVCIVAELKECMSNHVKAAKEWLGKAEHSFDKEQSIRGELNMMLAQAELKRAQEAKESDIKIKRRNRFIYRCFAASVAGMLVWIGSHTMAEDVPSAANNITIKETSPIVQEMSQTKKNAEVAVDVGPKTLEGSSNAVAAEMQQVERSQPIKKTIENKQPEQPSVQKTEKVEIAPEKMQQLMHEAGKSLRGQG